MYIKIFFIIILIIILKRKIMINHFINKDFQEIFIDDKYRKLNHIKKKEYIHLMKNAIILLLIQILGLFILLLQDL